MGRPEPCILFAHSFVHSQLDEYVDEVLFGEPVVVTGCEFLEQNASPSSSSVSLIGATSPPSFALEVFVHSEGESRFRRLCQPFLYSPSSSNVLEVEAVVTNHLVVRGSYRCLTLVVYGNTAEDLGQFRLGVELDDSSANLVYSLEGKLEDLPPALRVINVSLEESISCSELSSLKLPESDLSAEMMELLQLIFKIVQMHGHVNTISDVADAVVSVVSLHLSSDFGPAVTICNQKLCNVIDNEKDSLHTFNDLVETIDVLQELYKRDQPLIGSESTNISENEVQCKSEMANSEFLVYLFNQCFPSFDKEGADKNGNFHQNKSIFLRLGIIFLLCSTKQSCFWFVNSGGMVHLDRIFSCKVRASTAMTLLLLCVVEQATRYAVGCEGFLGWWPREYLNVPDNNSDGYCHLLNLLVQKQRHDVASLATYILHRLRSYEIAARYESAVLSLLTNLTANSMLMADKLHSLASTNSLLKNILKLLNLRGPIEDPSYVVSAKSSILGQAEGPLSYRETVDFIAFSKYSFSTLDIDTHLLPLLKERGFLPLSAALLSSPILRAAGGRVMEVFVDIAASVEMILLSLLSCRSGLRFLLSEPDSVATLIFSLRGVEDSERAEYLTLRHAAVLISKGFYCCPQEIGTIAELHLRVGNTIDRLLAAPPHSEEQLWILWELCGISRSDSGRQAVLAIGQHPEAVSVLIKALHSYKDSEQLGLNTGSSPLSLAIFHSAAEIIEVIVMDSSATSLASWIQLAVDLHKALHSSSPGFNRKDAPTRVLEWIDAGVVYHRNGVIGLIRYAAILASGGDAHLSSGNVLVSDSMDVENVIGESNSTLDSLSVDNLLGKLVSDKYFDGVALHNTSIVQLTTTFRILAFISENRVVASSLFEEGSMTLIYVVLVNCRFMLERSSNTFDYLVDEGAECNSTSDLLLERSLERTVAELLISCLVLLNNLLQRLHEAKEQYRNTKLLKVLLRLHRELSPKVAACVSDFSSQYPHSVLVLCTICRLIVSALACWPIFGWIPGLFHCLLESIQASSSLAMGPKDACSLLYLLGDLFPEEGIWLWKDGVPLLSAVRTLSVGTILGPEAERLVNWHLQPEHLTVLLGRLTPQLGKIAQIVLHFAFSALVAMQDMVRVFIIRICCLKGDCADVLLNPIISCVDDHIKEAANLSEIDYFKVYRLLDFTARLLEHPQAKMLLPKIGIMNTVQNVLQHCYDAYIFDERLVTESRIPAKSSANLHSLCMPCFKLLALIFSSCEPMLSSCLFNEYSVDNFDIMVTSRIMVLLHNFFKVLPVGRELVACLEAFKAIACIKQGRSLFLSNFMEMQTPPFEVECGDKKNENSAPGMCDWNSSPPLLVCWKKLLRVLHMKDNSFIWAVEGVRMLAMCCLCLCIEGKNLESIATLKSLFGFSHGAEDRSLSEEILEHLNEIVAILDQKTYEDELLLPSTMKKTLSLVKELVKSVISLLKQSDSSIDVESNSCSGSTSADAVSSLVPSLLPVSSAMKTSECFEISSPFSFLFRSSWDNEKGGYSSSLVGLAEGFVWECADTAPPDRLMMSSLSTKRRHSSEGSSRRSRDSMGPEAMGPNSFPRGVGAIGSSSGPTRRDTFRQRKPNTSRPPSMHVDDYVARERNSDGVGGGINAVTAQRGGMTSGRPPSIHVDEFMARQKERQNSLAVTVGDAVQTRNAPPINGNVPEKPDKSLKLKADLDDDLQEINIIFDDESESDDRLPFLQPDDNLQPGPVIAGGNSPGSIVEENESDVNDAVQQVTTPPATEDGDSSLDRPLRRQSSLSDTAMALEKCPSSEKNYSRQIKQKLFLQEQSAESKYVAPSMKSFDKMPPSSLGALKFYNVSPAPSLPHMGNSLISSTSKYPTDCPQKTATTTTSSSGGFQGYERKPSIGQPPLPPTPPPIFSSLPPQISQTEKLIPYIHSGRETQPPLPSGSPVLGFDVSVPGSISNFHVYSERLSSMTGSSLPSTTTQTLSNSRYSWASVNANNKMKVETYTSSSSASPLPPLPTTPPPSHLMTHTPAPHSGSQPSSYTQVMQLSLPSTPGLFSTSGSTLTTYSLPPFSPWQASISGTASSVTLQPGQNPPTILQSITAAQSSVQSLLPRPPPPPPPQAPRPSNHQNSRPSIQVSHISSEQVISLQSPIQVQVQPLHVQQQLQIPQIVYYQAQQQENLLQPPQSSLEQPQHQSLQPQADSKSQQHDSGVTLQQYFSSPEAIQSLLSDRDKLCQLLEQHPKLMQMLQERLGQL